uniref:Uncharacterized protein LOC8275559 isoform X1 n=1 Tax=Rhizophora mucronata TaxID=61149 RepID=A0A2P2L9V2_RHIMU
MSLALRAASSCSSKEPFKALLALNWLI